MPTRTGWGLLVAGALFVVSGRLFGAIEFLVVGIAAVTAVVVAVLLRQLHQADSRSSANSRPRWCRSANRLASTSR